MGLTEPWSGSYRICAACGAVTGVKENPAKMALRSVEVLSQGKWRPHGIGAVVCTLHDVRYLKRKE